MENEISPWIMWELNKLRSENEKLRKVAEASEIARRILKPQCSNYGGKMPCYCHNGTFEQGVAIDPPDQSPDCYMYEELDKALKEWKGKNGQG